jgi:hypothetical protein
LIGCCVLEGGRLREQFFGSEKYCLVEAILSPATAIPRFGFGCETLG